MEYDPFHSYCSVKCKKKHLFDPLPDERTVLPFERSELQLSDERTVLPFERSELQVRQIAICMTLGYNCMHR